MRVIVLISTCYIFLMFTEESNDFPEFVWSLFRSNLKHEGIRSHYIGYTNTTYYDIYTYTYIYIFMYT